MRYLFPLLISTVMGGAASGSPAEAVAAAKADAERLPYELRTQTRYLSLHEIPPEQRVEVSRTVDFWVNSLSRNSELIRCRRIGTIALAVAVSDYGWDATVFGALADTDPWFHLQVLRVYPAGYYGGRYYRASTVQETALRGFPGHAELAALVESRCPIVDAAWFVAVTSRQLGLNNKDNGTGYYSWLGVTKRKDFERLVRLDADASRDIGREIRAAVEASGVAQNNRQVVRLQALTGGAWVTLDVEDPTGFGNAVRFLDRRDFKHAAEEHFAPLPNGLFAFLLCDVKGNLQATAPDFIGADTTSHSRDGRIHAGKSCISCHAGGLLPVDDWVRRTLRSPLGLQEPDYAKFLELRRQYFSDLSRQLKRDNELYAEAVRALNGRTPGDNAKLFIELYDFYVNRPRTAADVALALGVTEAKLVQALTDYAANPPKGQGRIDLAFAPLLQKGTIRVEALEEMVPLLYEILGTK